jgi:hypothetical protein
MSLAVGVARIGVAVLIGYSFSILGEVSLLIFLVFVIAIPYEVLRTRVKEARGAQQQRIVLWIWLLVGLGYPIRAGLGLAFAGFSLFSSTMIIAVAYFAAFGVMFVLMTWVLDATSYCYVGQDDRWHALGTLSEKPHLGTLLKRTNVKLVDTSGSTVRTELYTKPEQRTSELHYGGDERLLARDGLPFFTPWNFALISTAMMAGLLGMLLANPPRTAVEQLTLIALITLAGSILVARVKLAAIVAVLVLFVPAALTMVGRWTEARNPALTFIPWLAAIVTYLVFRRSSYRDLKKFAGIFSACSVRKIVKMLLSGSYRMALFVLKKLVGEKTWKATFIRNGHSEGVGSNDCEPV